MGLGFRRMRKKWIKANDFKEQMIGTLKNTIALARYFEDEHDGQSNDISLLWYKRSMNVLEKLGVIDLKQTSVDHVIDSFDINQRCFLEASKHKISKIMIGRKRINSYFYPNDVVKYAESVMQSYMACLIEKFRQRNYKNGLIYGLDVKYQCFVDWKQNPKKYNNDFDIYLRTELDSLFEINHFHFSEFHRCYLHSSEIEMADVYNNYAAYLSDVLSDYHGAELWYEMSLEYDSKDPTTFWNLAEIYEKTSRYLAAKQKYDWALKYMPKNDAQAYKAMAADVKNAQKRIDAIIKRSRI